MPAAHDVYVGQLGGLGLQYGYPLYHPDPPQGETSIELGDVGFTREGSFIRLFSASKQRDHPVQVHGVPDNFEQLDLGVIQIRNNELEPGPLYSESVDTVQVNLGSPGPVLPLDASFNFNCTSAKGAVLMLETQMKYETTLQDQRIDTYLRRNCLSWHEFARRNGFGLSFSDLMLVVGCSKTAGWSSSVYWDSKSGFDLSFSLGMFAVKSKKTGIVLNRKSESRPINPNRINQTVFIKTYRLGSRQLYHLSLARLFIQLFNRKRGRPTDNDKHGEESTAAARALLNNPELSGGVNMPTSGSVEALAPQVDFNPAAVLLGLELETSDADCAVVHDDIWCFPTPEVSKMVHEYTTFYFDEYPSLLNLSSRSGQLDEHKPDDTHENDIFSVSDQNLSSDSEFLSAHGGYGLSEQDRFMNWDNYIVSTADRLASMELSSNTLERSHQISLVCALLIKILGNRQKYMEFLSFRKEAAQDLLDLLQKLLDHAPLPPRLRGTLYTALVRLCRRSELCPPCFFLTDIRVDSHVPLLHGGFGDIYKAQHDRRVVCVKAVKVYEIADRLALEKAYSREAVVWGQLSHPNILPFSGIYRLDDHNQTLCLVSPWMHNGNIREFLSTPAQSQRDRTPLIHDVASGMKYLHDNGIVHGDLKGAKILVTESERACLADFGFSYATELSGLGGLAFSSRQADGGTMSFEAPELVESESARTSASDIFAFGMACFEIFTGELPLSDKRRVVTYKIHLGQRPKRPTGEVHVQRGLSSTMWALMERCWSSSPKHRPTAAEILRELPPVETSLQSESREWTRTQRPGFTMSDGQVDATIAKALAHLQPLL
ncbi:Serine/threonine-protein kinase HT1 [Termitomyces sp. J132]|nr:Serine/threonine-protein kinase HT1 [Termitomyces sp. J132]